MATFNYNAVEPSGSQVQGTVDAADLAAATAQLESQGLTEISVVPATDFSQDVQDSSAAALSTGTSRSDTNSVSVPASSDTGNPEPSPTKPISVDAGIEIADVVSDLTAANLPLAPGLRAAAQDASDHRVQSALRQLASLIDAGSTLESAIQQMEGIIPPHIIGLVSAANRTHGLADVLIQYSDDRRRRKEIWNQVWQAISYPIVVASLSLALLVFGLWIVVPPFEEMFEDFGIRLPWATQAVITLSHAIGPAILFVFGSAISIAMVVRILFGPVGFRKALISIPLLGRVLLWQGTSEGLRLLALFVRHGEPTDKALALTACGCSDPYIAAQFTELERQVSQGQSLGNAVQYTRLPQTLAAFLGWGEHAGNLSNVLSTAAEAYEERVRIRARFYRVLFPPFVFILILGGSGGVVSALFVPLVSLVQGLS